jgi:hypothetical protein
MCNPCLHPCSGRSDQSTASTRTAADSRSIAQPLPGRTASRVAEGSNSLSQQRIAPAGPLTPVPEGAPRFTGPGDNRPLGAWGELAAHKHDSLSRLRPCTTPLYSMAAEIVMHQMQQQQQQHSMLICKRRSQCLSAAPKCVSDTAQHELHCWCCFSVAAAADAACLPQRSWLQRAWTTPSLVTTITAFSRRSGRTLPVSRHRKRTTTITASSRQSHRARSPRAVLQLSSTMMSAGAQ